MFLFSTGRPSGHSEHESAGRGQPHIEDIWWVNLQELEVSSLIKIGTRFSTVSQSASGYPGMVTSLLGTGVEEPSGHKEHGAARTAGEGTRRNKRNIKKKIIIGPKDNTTGCNCNGGRQSDGEGQGRVVDRWTVVWGTC